MSATAQDGGAREVIVFSADIRRGRPRRWARSLREFAAVPAVVITGFCLLAAVCITGDQTHDVALLDSARRVAGHLVGKQASTTALQAIATGLVTVASITFSVLLLAVQQTATSLSPVVLDQFIRRRSNQAFLGFFIGLALFAYVVMAAVQDAAPPVLGATVATVSTIVALIILLLLVYSTVAQMRPTNVLGAIHDRALAAREKEARIVRRTRRESTSGHDVAVFYRSGVTGYLTHLDLDRMARALRDAEDAEICLHVSLGAHVTHGDMIASVRDGDVTRAERIGHQVAAALTVGQKRDLAHDPTTGIDQLGNIAWTSGSTSKHNPEVAREALNALEDLAARWLADDPAQRRRDSREPIPVVYQEDVVGRLLDVFFSMLIVAHESEQHTFAAAVLNAYRNLIDRSHDPVAERLCADVAEAQGLLDEIPPSPQLRRARRAVDAAVEQRQGFLQRATTNPEYTQLPPSARRAEARRAAAPPHR